MELYQEDKTEALVATPVEGNTLEEAK